MSDRTRALIALSRDRATSRGERALAAHHAARLLAQQGIDYLSVYPAGLPVLDEAAL
jgi:hypothetical protein